MRSEVICPEAPTEEIKECCTVYDTSLIRGLTLNFRSNGMVEIYPFSHPKYVLSTKPPMDKTVVHVGGLCELLQHSLECEEDSFGCLAKDKNEAGVVVIDRVPADDETRIVFAMYKHQDDYCKEKKPYWIVFITIDEAQELMKVLLRWVGELLKELTDSGYTAAAAEE